MYVICVTCSWPTGARIIAAISLALWGLILWIGL
jgi:hypothetical protein